MVFGPKERNCRPDLFSQAYPEKNIEQNMLFYLVFVDFTEAFDTVNRVALWKILKKLGCPDRFVDHVMQKYKQ